MCQFASSFLFRYHGGMFNFGQPKTITDWIVHIVGAIIAIFLVLWMLRVYVL